MRESSSSRCGAAQNGQVCSSLTWPVPLETYAMRWAFQNRSKASGAPGSSKPSVAAASADARACARASDPPVPGLVMG